MNIRLFALAAIAFACAPDEGPVTARVGAAVFDGRASASYFADGRFFGFIASSEDRATQIEVRVEGIDAEEVGVFEVTPSTANEIRLSLGGTDRTGVGSIEVASFTLEIDQDVGVGEGRAKGTFSAQLDGLAIDDGAFDIPVFSGDICNQNVEARTAFDCP